MDPFTAQLFAALRRRHLDVDIVVVPADPPPLAEEQQASDVEVHASLSLVAAEAERLWALTAPGPVPPPVVRLGHDDRDGAVSASARGAQHRPDGYAVLLTLRADLEQAGADVRRLDGRLEGIRATLPGLAVTASYAEQTGALLLTVQGDALEVGDRAAALVRAARQSSRDEER